MSLTRVLSTAGTIALLVGCSAQAQDEDRPPEQSDSQKVDSTEEALSVKVHLVTESGRIGANYDDEMCVWGQTSYTLRDASGTIIATGDVESDLSGSAEVGGEPGLLGSVRGRDPYMCVLPFTIRDFPSSDFYELEVATDSPRSEGKAEAEVTFDEAKTSSTEYVTVEISG